MITLYVPVGKDRDREIEIIEWLEKIPPQCFVWICEYEEIQFMRDEDATAFKLKFKL